MRSTELATVRSENNSSSWGTSVWRSIAMPALPPSRREKESRAATFASRLLEPIATPAIASGTNRG